MLNRGGQENRCDGSAVSVGSFVWWWLIVLGVDYVGVEIGVQFKLF